MSDRVPLMISQDDFNRAFEVVKKYIDAEIAELKAKPTFEYKGVWDAQKVYRLGDFVTDEGSLWHCAEASIGVRPGSGGVWQLAVKRGRDAKGSR